jgi:hypothetical protein
MRANVTPTLVFHTATYHIGFRLKSTHVVASSGMKFIPTFRKICHFMAYSMVAHTDMIHKPGYNYDKENRIIKYLKMAKDFNLKHFNISIPIVLPIKFFVCYGMF